MLPGRFPSSLASRRAIGDGRAVAGGPLRLRQVLLLGYPQGQAAQGGLGGLLVLLGLAIAIDPVRGGGDRVAHRQIGPGALGGQLGQGAQGLTRMGALEQVHGRGHGLAVEGAGELLALSAAHQQDTLRRHAGDVIEEQGASALAVQVTPAHDLRQSPPARLVDGLRGSRQLALVEDPEDQAGGLLLGELAGLDLELHHGAPRGV